MGRAPRATILAAGDRCVPLNSCYVALCRNRSDALALAALLNSAVADAWLAALAEPARGGYHRFLGWTMSLFPLPADWPRARDALAPIAEAAMRGDQDPLALRDALVHEALAAYRLRHAQVAALLTWFGR